MFSHIEQRHGHIKAFLTAWNPVLGDLLQKLVQGPEEPNDYVITEIPGFPEYFAQHAFDPREPPDVLEVYATYIAFNRDADLVRILREIQGAEIPRDIVARVLQGVSSSPDCFSWALDAFFPPDENPG